MTEPMSDKVTPELVEKAFALLCQKYVQRADARQKTMGLQYTEAETHDLAELMASFAATPLVKMREALEATKETLTLLNDRFEVHMGKRSAEIDILLTEIDAALSSNLEGG